MSGAAPVNVVRLKPCGVVLLSSATTAAQSTADEVMPLTCALNAHNSSVTATALS